MSELKPFAEYLKESLMAEGAGCPGCGTFKKENEEEEQERLKAIRMGAESEEEEQEKVAESVKSEKDFKDYAKNKFKVVFGDKLDEKKMNDTIDGIIKDNAEDVEKGDWGKLVGILNKSFGA